MHDRSIGRIRRSRADLAQIEVVLPEPNSEQLALLSKKEEAHYWARRRALDMYRAGQTALSIRDETGVGIQQVTRDLAAAVRIRRDTASLLGYAACIPRARPKTSIHKRRKPLVVPENGQGLGLKCALQDFFAQHPDIRRDLDTYISNRSIPGSAVIPTINSGSVLRVFYELCQRKNLHEDRTRWPYCTKRHGANAIRRYYANWKALNPIRAAVNEMGQEVARKASIDIGVANNSLKPLPPLGLAYGRIEIDEHKLDLSSVVCFQNKAGLTQKVRVHRLHVIVAIETRSKCILACLVVFGPRYNYEDVLTLLRMALVAPVRRPLKLLLPDYGYLPEARFPSEDSRFKRLTWAEIALDSDAAHKRLSVDAGLQKRLGCSFFHERIGQPTARASVERLFGRISDLLSQTPSAVGSSPGHPSRFKAAGGAEKYGVSNSDIDELADVWARNYNATFLPSLGMSPLEALDQMYTSGEMFLNYAGDWMEHQPHLLFPRFGVEMRMSSNGTGVPVVSFAYAVYSGPGMHALRSMVARGETAATLYINSEDARFAWLVPMFDPSITVELVVQDRQLRNAPMSLNTRRLLAHEASLKGHIALATSPSIIEGALMTWGERANQGDRHAGHAASVLSGEFARTEAGMIPDVMSNERKALLLSKPVEIAEEVSEARVYEEWLHSADTLSAQSRGKSRRRMGATKSGQFELEREGSNFERPGHSTRSDVQVPGNAVAPVFFDPMGLYE